LDAEDRRFQHRPRGREQGWCWRIAGPSRGGRRYRDRPPERPLPGGFTPATSVASMDISGRSSGAHTSTERRV